MSGVDVRPAREGEVAAAAHLRWRWVVEDTGGDPATDPTTGRATDRDAFVASTVRWARAHADTHRCVVAVRDGEVVGMAWWALVARVPSPRSLHRLTADVQSVYVLPQERGRGTGRRLVDAVVAAATAAGVERVVVHSSQRAIPLYDRAGFTPDERLRHRAVGTPGGTSTRQRTT